MALCSVAHVKCATGNYVTLFFSPSQALKNSSMMVDFKPPALPQFIVDKYNINPLNCTAATFSNLSVKSTSLLILQCFAGNAVEAINLYRKALQVIKDADYMALDDSIMERMRIDLAELLHVVGR